MKRLAEVDSPSTDPVWTKVRIPKRRPLRSQASADVCVVGAGIAGLTTAYLLAVDGCKVIVLDDGQIGGGQTTCTSAHLSNVIDDRFVEIERMHGPDGARLAAESHAAAIDRIEAIVRDEQIDCDFERVDGYLFSPPDDDSDLLDREYEAARRTGVLDVVRVPGAPWPEYDTGTCLRFARQAQFHPLKYLKGLASAIEKRGGKIYEGTHARQITGGDDAQVECEGKAAVQCRHIVVATNTPVNDMFAIHTKQAPYISYVIALRVRAGSVPHALYWDTADPYHYLRVQPGGARANYELLIVGGEDHKTGQADDGELRFAELEAWARHRFPEAGPLEAHWAGQVMETVDGLAFIGRNPLDKPNVYIATGDSGMGLTHGTIAGLLLTDLIAGRENPWEDLYSPSRAPTGDLLDFVKENVNVARQYGAWLTPGDVASVEEIPPESGAVLRRGLHKVAVYCDEHGQRTELSAVCPHLKCIVAWNATEHTWDCPCHGSRFDPKGKVLNGPANVDLPPAQSTDE